MSKSREQLVKYLSEIDITDKVVLDAGVGSKPAKDYTKGTPKKYVTLDVDKKFNPDWEVDLNSPEALGSRFSPIKILFDTIFCLETLEHLYLPINAVETVFNSLKAGGKAYFSTPFINPYHDEVDYARYTDEWYKEVLDWVGFKDIKIKPRVATVGLPHLLEFYRAEGLRMSKLRLKRGEAEKLSWIGLFVEATK